MYLPFSQAVRQANVDTKVNIAFKAYETVPFNGTNVWARLRLIVTRDMASVNKLQPPLPNGAQVSAEVSETAKGLNDIVTITFTKLAADAKYAIAILDAHAPLRAGV